MKNTFCIVLQRTTPLFVIPMKPLFYKPFNKLKIMSKVNMSNWKLIIKVIAAVATAILGVIVGKGGSDETE